MSGKADIKSMSPEELEAFFKELGEPAYRAKQVFAWIHRGVRSFDEMTDIKKDLRERLGREAEFTNVSVRRKLVSEIDGTVKYLYGLEDGESVESVVMDYGYGGSVCISTQVGCRMGCAFCASGIAGLSAAASSRPRCSTQVLMAKRDSGMDVTHCVLMGIGEPLDNYDNVVKFLDILSCPGGTNMSLRHVSLSTCGRVDGILRLAKLKLGLTLSVSLHAPNDRIRSQLMPVNKKWGIDELLDACRVYVHDTGRRISFEYAMFRGVNDSERDARELAGRLRGILCHVNLIPANDVKETGLTKSTGESVRRFRDILAGYGLNVTVRRTLGADINASCGQLRRAEGLRSDKA
jgi:23S rRNA (adenine2503-C2)-methyltransferase